MGGADLENKGLYPAKRPGGASVGGNYKLGKVREGRGEPFNGCGDSAIKYGLNIWERAARPGDPKREKRFTTLKMKNGILPCAAKNGTLPPYQKGAKPQEETI